MYLWVVLTTFLAMIAAYVLPIRQDTREIQTVPVAQAKMIQMVVKQNAGQEYMKHNAWPYWSGATETNKAVNFQSGRLDDLADFENYLPRGFINNPSFKTELYCMNEELTVIRNGAGGCRKLEDVPIKRLLITYGPIPERWKTLSGSGGYDVRPSTDLIQAMREQFAAKTMAGYLVREGGKTYVVNYESRRFEVPIPVEGYVNACLNDYYSCMAIMSWR